MAILEQTELLLCLLFVTSVSCLASANKLEEVSLGAGAGVGLAKELMFNISGKICSLLHKVYSSRKMYWIY